jgi:sulfate adenylyltransferase
MDDLELLTHGVLGEPPRFELDDPVSLEVADDVAEQAETAGSIQLVDPEGTPLAVLHVEASQSTASGRRLAGPVSPLAAKEFGAFRRLYRTPREVREELGADVLTVPVAHPLTEGDLKSIEEARGHRSVLLLALAGHGTPSYAGRRLSPTGLLRATLAAAGLLPDATVVAAPLAARAGEPTEADRALRERVVAAFAPGEVLEVAGEGELPEAVAEVVEFELPDRQHQGLVLFFTGLSGSGKSTLARALHDVILERGQRTVTSLDGDVVRRNLSAGLTFSREDRETNIRRIGWVAAEISRHRGIAICSPIAPFDETRKQVRAMVDEAGGRFFLVHVATPLEECERRDRKGLYAKARRGEIPEFTGISSPYEEPADADVRVDTTGRSIDDALADILTALDEAGYLPKDRS